LAIENSVTTVMPELLIATNNAGKLKEYRAIIACLPLTLLTLADVGITVDVPETGATFAENAAIKAREYARLASIPTLADDSGLSIDYLGGRPGVLSARYAGESATDRDRIDKVLSEMSGAKNRSARFVCVAALADDTGAIVASVNGTCEGTLTIEPRGLSGFGYDPIFLPAGFDKTFAELDPEAKNRISHRANAALKIIPFLQGFFDI
jgi:XTP/dITP diphosphohydrolase